MATYWLRYIREHAFTEEKLPIGIVACTPASVRVRGIEPEKVPEAYLPVGVVRGTRLADTYRADPNEALRAGCGTCFPAEFLGARSGPVAQVLEELYHARVASAHKQHT